VNSSDELNAYLCLDVSREIEQRYLPGSIQPRDLSNWFKIPSFYAIYLAM
jgi:hypothetical protein